MSTKRVLVAFTGCVLISAMVAYFTASRIARGTAAAADPPKLTAREFVLVDEHGHVGATLCWKNGQPQLQLFDGKDHVRSALFLEPNGVPDLYLYDGNNSVRAALNLFDSGVPNLAFLDESQTHMVFTEFDIKNSYNTVFQEIGKKAAQTIAARKITAEKAGLHVVDTSGGLK